MNALSGDVNAQLKCIALIDADLTTHLYWVWCVLTDAQKFTLVCSKTIIPQQVPH